MYAWTGSTNDLISKISSIQISVVANYFIDMIVRGTRSCFCVLTLIQT